MESYKLDLEGPCKRTIACSYAVAHVQPGKKLQLVTDILQ